MEYRDYYQILGVSKDATPDEIKKQYRRMARKYHPDVSKEKDAEEKFKAMKEAYEVLKDPEKRKAYDQMGSQFNGGDSFTPPPEWSYQHADNKGGDHFSEADFSDFFESLFGQQRHSTRQRQSFKRPGQDQHTKITITLDEAFKGSTKQLSLTQPTLDEATGAVVRKTKQLKVKIPAGVTQGQQIRLADQGGAGVNGGKNGDLYLEVTIAAHPFFKLDKKDIYLNLPVTPWEAALGEKVQVPTLGGLISFSLPENAQSGQKIRLKGRGLPGSNVGDQYIILSVQIPPAKTQAQKSVYLQMQKEMPFNPREGLFEGSAS